MHKHNDPCPFLTGCPGKLLVSRSERVPGTADYSAVCNTCGRVDGWTESTVDDAGEHNEGPIVVDGVLIEETSDLPARREARRGSPRTPKLDP